MAQITGADLIAPKGPITTTFFPGVQDNALAAYLDAYVSRAYADDRVSGAPDETKKNRAAFALSSNLALMEVYGRMLGEPTDVTIQEKGNTKYTKDQRDGIRDLADK